MAGRCSMPALHCTGGLSPNSLMQHYNVNDRSVARVPGGCAYVVQGPASAACQAQHQDGSKGRPQDCSWHASHQCTMWQPVMCVSALPCSVRP